MYHHVAGVDFNRCEKGKCFNCSDNQKIQCEKELDEAYINVAVAKIRVPAKRGERPFIEFPGHES